MTASVRLLQLENVTWQTQNFTTQELAQRFANLRGRFIIYISLPKKVDLTLAEQQALSDAFNIPSKTLTTQYKKATGFFSADQRRTKHGDVEHYNTAFRFLIKNVTADDPPAAKLNETIAYHWIEIGLWTSWKPSHSSALICIVRDESGTDHFWPSLEQNLLQKNELPSGSHEQPFLWHQFIMPYISEAFYTSIWSCRDRIRYLEENRSSSVPDTRPPYQTMHEVARHAIHITEVMAMAITVVSEMIEAVRNFSDPINRPNTGSHDNERVSDSLICQKTLLQCSHGRSEALNSRLQNEINLAFHLGAERDSKTAASMAHSMQKDSTAMKTISVLGLVFLPGTFISAIFGMTFFNFATTSEEWTVSSRFWIYWVVTIPVTFATWAIWQVLTRRETKT